VQSYLGLRDISMVSSPFVSRELMQYIFAFPSKIRLNHELYFKWMERHMPVAMQYRWENTGLHPAYGNMQIKPDSQIVKNLKRIDEIFNKGKPERSRNPYQYWIKNNEQIMDEVINYCTYRISLIEDSPRLYQFIKTILSHDNIYLCIRAATLLGLLSLCYRYE
jgi:asparagine synthase (glutamine-hydrolysing)